MKNVSALTFDGIDTFYFFMKIFSQFSYNCIGLQSNPLRTFDNIY